MDNKGLIELNREVIIAQGDQPIWCEGNWCIKHEYNNGKVGAQIVTFSECELQALELAWEMWNAGVDFRLLMTKARCSATLYDLDGNMFASFDDDMCPAICLAYVHWSKNRETLTPATDKGGAS